MKCITDTTEFKLHNTVVALGKFDGLHRGHRILIDSILKEKQKGFQVTMFTFDFHPANLLHSKEIDLIYTNEERQRKAEEIGIDILVEYPFTEETSRLLPEEFVEQIIVNKLGAKIVAVGSDFRFSYNRAGDVTALQEMSEKFGFQLIICNKLKYKGQDISSSCIRECISCGDIKCANDMLGSPFQIYGKVVYGRKLGRTIGFRTANIYPDVLKLLPNNGVYISKIKIKNKIYEGITNIGYNPTVTNDRIKVVETHVHNFNEDIYDEYVEVMLYHFIRPERKFNDLIELKNQLLEDVEYSKRYFQD